MERQLRRVVTSHEADGKAVVLFDGAPVKIRERPESGLKSWLLWIDRFDARRHQRIAGPRRSHHRHSAAARRQRLPHRRLPPVRRNQVAARPHDAQHRRRPRAASKGWAPRHPAMHRTRSIDYAIVMSGEIDMLLDEFGNSSESRRRARSAKHQSCLGQSRNRTVPHRLRADRCAGVLIAQSKS